MVSGWELMINDWKKGERRKGREGGICILTQQPTVRTAAAGGGEVQ